MDVLTLTTPRLELRPFTHADIDTLHAQWIDPDVRRYLWDGVEIAREQAAAIVEESVATFAARRFGMWLALARDDGRTVGFAGLRASSEWPGVELYYGLARAEWGRGLATEAACAVLRYGFEEVGLDPIWIRTDGPNLASVAVMERLGARYASTDPEGAFGTTLTYAVRRADFALTNPAEG